MKVLTFSRHYPKGHNKQGQPTWFVEKVWKSIWDAYEGANNPLYPYWQIYDEAFPLQGDFEENIHQHQPKHHTIRAGNRFKVGDTASLRVWSGKPYNSKQVEFAQVEVKKVWDIEIYQNEEYWIFTLNGKKLTWDDLDVDQFVDDLAKNDGLTTADFLSWFSVHPKKKEQVFTGQIICWNETITY